MYEQFYGLRERPFDLSANAKFLFLSAQHHEALTHLRYGLSGRPGITLLVGDAGLGKSTLVRAALESSAGGPSKVALLSNPTLTRNEFYEYLAGEFELDPEVATSKTKFLAALETSIDECHRNGGGLGLIVDEAQSLPHELLEELRLLTNSEGSTGRSLTLLLVGQPELSERLDEASLRQLKQRVALRAELRPFTLKETAGYISSRITVAGGRADAVFTRDAVIAIHEAARGLPRTISVICDNALVTGFADNVKPVGRDIVSTVCADFNLVGVTPSAPTIPVAAPTAEPVAAAATGEGAEKAPESDQPSSMFTDYAPAKRFSFFRGARR